MPNPAISKLRVRWGIAGCLFVVAVLVQHWVRSSDLVEKIPDITSITNDPEAQKYISNLSWSKQEPVVAVSDRKEPAIPVDRSRIQGRILEADHNTNCWMWAIQTYDGQNWTDQQKLYVYSEKDLALQEVTAFAHKTIGSQSFVLSDVNGSEPFIVTSVGWHDGYSPWADELWTYNIRTKEASRVSLGQLEDVSPDRSTVRFWRVDRNGFHCLYLWNIKSGEIEPVISMWEGDPGSGPGWDCRWSADSEAIEITGSCGGFSKKGSLKHTELNLIYLVKDKKFISLQ